MLNLTGERYLPDLAPGYKWYCQLDTSTPYVLVSIYRMSYAGPKETVYKEYVDISLAETKEEIRSLLIDKAEKMVSQRRPWNPEHAALMKQVFKSLIRPEDTERSSFYAARRSE